MKALLELTRLRPSERDLPPEFRLQLQILNCAMHQHRLLQQVALQQMQMARQVDALDCRWTRTQELTQQHLEELRQGFDHLGSHLQQQAQREESGPEGFAGVEKVDIESESWELPTHAPPQTCKDGDLKGGLQVEGILSHSVSVVSGSERILNRQPQGLLHKTLTGPAFECLCAAVIIFNAVLIGISTQESLIWQLEHVGGGQKQPSSFLVISDIACLVFFCLELVLKLVTFRGHFFCGDESRWNLFDVVLVVTGLYDFGHEAVISGMGKANDTSIIWIRLLRLAKVAKMLRVVRVMRMFRILRMMVTVIAINMMTLIWTIVMLFLVMYIFSLFFLQGISSYLQDTPASAVPADTMEAIRTYWSSVLQSLVTLYFSVTGGSDWEPLAAPLWAAGQLYYLVFLFYVAFLFFSVLNVLTGLYADEAGKVSQKDDELVVQELNGSRHTKEFREIITPLLVDGEFLTWTTFKRHLNDAAVQNFLSVTQLTPLDCKRVFKYMAGRAGMVSVSQFIEACLRSNVTTTALELMRLNMLVERLLNKMTRA